MANTDTSIKYYTIQLGDTLSEIAQDVLLHIPCGEQRVQRLLELNPQITNKHKIREGQKIRVSDDGEGTIMTRAQTQEEVVVHHRTTAQTRPDGKDSDGASVALCSLKKNAASAPIFDRRAQQPPPPPQRRRATSFIPRTTEVAREIQSIDEDNGDGEGNASIPLVCDDTPQHSSHEDDPPPPPPCPVDVGRVLCYSSSERDSDPRKRREVHAALDWVWANYESYFKAKMQHSQQKEDDKRAFVTFLAENRELAKEIVELDATCEMLRDEADQLDEDVKFGCETRDTQKAADMWQTIRTKLEDLDKLCGDLRRAQLKAKERALQDVSTVRAAFGAEGLARLKVLLKSDIRRCDIKKVFSVRPKQKDDKDRAEETSPIQTATLVDKPSVRVAVKKIPQRTQRSSPCPPGRTPRHMAERERIVHEAIKKEFPDHHPNLVPYFGTFIDPVGDYIYILTEKQPQTLLEWIAHAPPDALAVRIQKMIEITQGLQVLHDCFGVIHGDLKPANILVSQAGQAMLCDFNSSGIARDTSKRLHTTSSSLPHSTQGYTAPEHKSGGPFTTKTDVYVLGIVFLDILRRFNATSPPPRLENADDDGYQRSLREFEQRVTIHQRLIEFIQTQMHVDDTPSMRCGVDEVLAFLRGIHHQK